MLLKTLTVVGLATFELYAAIPMGFALGLSSWTILFATIIGGLTGVFIAAFLGDRIRKFFFRNKAVKEKQNKNAFIHRIWRKHGAMGLGFLGTLSVGAPISIAVGTGLNANLRKLLTWCCIGVISRSMIFTLVGHYGFQLF